MCYCVLMPACMFFTLYWHYICSCGVDVHLFCVNFYIFSHVCVSVCVCVFVCVYVSMYFFLSVCVRVCLQHPLNCSANSVALAAGRFGVMLLPRHPSRKPGGDRVWGGLLGHAVVADHCVEAAPGVGVLRSVVGLQRGRDTPLVLWREKRAAR